ncbi:hypothetical protein F4778DRAFT_794597 [Xylariomycetidae sp. FL2044]|nr:hypothetical protein F4778DRAFT_794597 [Xylariomycetidae sp. FL2044]
MATSQTAREDGDFFPFTIESSPNIPQSPSTDSKPKRSLTPRGPLFNDLGEAHRNITSRMPSNNPFRSKGSDTESSFNESLKDQSSGSFGKPIVGRTAAFQRDANPRPSTSAPGRSLTHLPNPTPETSSSTQASSGPPVPSKMEPSRIEVPGLADALQRKLSASAPQPPHDSGSTVDKIYDQYATQSDLISSSIENSSHGYTFSAAHHSPNFEPVSRDGAATRCGFRGEETRGRQRHMQEKRRFAAAASTSHPPRRALPKAPSVATKQRSFLTSSDDCSPPPTSSVSNSQHLLDVDAQVDELREAHRALVPSPLRLPSKRKRNYIRQSQHSDFRSDAGLSVDNTGESNDDPFRYDSDGYQAVLCPTREKDISQALIRASAGGSRALRKAAPVNDENCAPQESANQQGENIGQDETTASPRRRKRHQGDFFDVNVLRGIASDEKKARDIKIVISRQPQVEAEDVCEKDNMYHSEIYANRDKMPKDSTNDGDWITEATSEVGFGRETTTADPFFKTGIKETGSSIANYSDTDDEGPRNPFDSREHIVQHPSGDSLSNYYEIRAVKDTSRQIFLPVPRNRHLKGFPQNSTRLYSSAVKEDNESLGPQVFRQCSNPFRTGNRKGGDAFHTFPYKTVRNQPSKYDFRDSTSEYAPAAISNQATQGTYGTLPSPDPEADNVGSPSAVDAHFDISADIEVDSSQSRRMVSQHNTQMAYPDNSKILGAGGSHCRQRQVSDISNKQFALENRCSLDPGPTSAGSKFGFELLPLDQAQLKYKKQRDSGETDETDTAVVRLQKIRSSTSTRRLSSPIDPPEPAHLRQPQISPELSSNFSPPDWRTLRDILQETPTPFAEAKHEYRPRTASGNKSWASDSPFSPNTYYTGTPTTVKRKLFVQHERRARPRPMGFAHTGGIVSQEAESRRKCWFYFMMVLSILPFFALLILTGVFDDSLAWFTKGQACELTRQQRRFIKAMFLTECVLYPSAMAAIIVVSVLKSEGVS